MRVAIRVDASREIGTGHVRRCMSLASALEDKGADVTFIARRHDPVGAIALGSEAFPVFWLAAPESGRGVSPDSPDPVPHARWAGVGWREDAADTVAAIRAFRPDWVIVDHYAFDARWHDEVRSNLDCQIMAIDDLADRALSVDLLLDANFAQDHPKKYEGRFMRKPRLLGGPRYALLSPAYKAAPRYAFSRDVKSLGVFMGGTDPGGVSARVLKVCREEGGFKGLIEVVSTSANPHLGALESACAADPDVQLSLDLSDLSTFYARHDLQVGAGGTATYERCCIGAPTIALIVASNQMAVVPGLADKGVLRAARLGDDPDADVVGVASPLGDVVRDLVAEPDARLHLSESGMALVDGLGADRVALCLLGASLRLRPAVLEDGEQLHSWRNSPSVRAVSVSGAEIPLDDHMAWLAGKLVADDARLYVGEIGSTAVGSIRFDRLDGELLEVSLYLDPDLAGMGLGPHLLLAGEREVVSEWSGRGAFVATVLSNNPGSAKLFTQSGYSGGPLRYKKPITT